MFDSLLPTRSREKIAADNRAELDGWIDERAAALVARGLQPEEARRRALEEFGDVGVASRYAEHQDVAADRRVRILLWAEELASDLRIAARTLARTPTVTSVVLLTFALGIGATTAVFSVVHAMLLRPLPYGDEGTLVYLQPLDNGVVGPNARFSAATLVELRERTTSFTGIASVEQGNYIVAENGDPEQIAGSALSGNAFELLELRVALGRGFTSEDAAAAGRILILSDDLWRRRFGADSAIVGRTIELSGSRREVVGVMPPGVRVPTYEGSQLWTPRDFSNILANPTARHVRNFRLVARLEPGVTRAAAQADVDRAMRSLQTELPQAYGGIDARLVPIRTAVAGDAKPRLLLLMGAAAFVLLIACANVSGILLSRAIARGHELSVRVALGAGRRRLARQFLVEGVVLAVCGVAFGLLVAQFGIGVLRQIATTALPVGTVFALEPRVLVFAVAVATAAALACSLVPAIAATRVRGVALRRDDGKASLSRANRRLRLGLVAGQLAVSVVLLVGAGLLLRTLHRLSSLDVGYATDHALTFRLPFTRPKSDAEQDAFYASLYRAIARHPGRDVGRRREHAHEWPAHRRRPRDRRSARGDRTPARRALCACVGRLLRDVRHSDPAWPRVQRRRSRRARRGWRS